MAFDNKFANARRNINLSPTTSPAPTMKALSVFLPQARQRNQTNHQFLLLSQLVTIENDHAIFSLCQKQHISYHSC
jgi:hypothetical protein